MSRIPSSPRTFPTVLAFALALALGLGVATPAASDDTALFSVTVAPNVVLLVDNSGSMNNLVWHPAFNAAATPTCTYYVNTTEYSFSTDVINLVRCGKTVSIYKDPAIAPASMRVTGRYLNWLFSPESDLYNAEINLTANGTYSTCLGGGTYAKYRRARITAAQDVLREVICQVNQAGKVRFGMAQFRSGGDPNGGYIRVPANDYLNPDGTPYSYSLDGSTKSHGQHLNDAISALDAVSNTPLGESLFQVYTYFMSRSSSDFPLGKDGSTKFPKYSYKTAVGSSGGGDNTSSPPGSPVSVACQKNFVILLTDGEPTTDDFDTGGSPSNTTLGFGDFKSKLIGNYVADAEVEEPGDSVETAYYLDDIAAFMQTHDFRPDMDGDQLIDVYTVGFTTTPIANSLLSRTAANGNGLFFQSNNAEELATHIVSALADIIQKSQSFTVPTVPTTRASEGARFYNGYFIPSDRNGWWEGHLRSWTFTALGQIFDKNGACALDDPSGQCLSGTFRSTAQPWWDAGEKVPPPSSRKLFTSIVTAPGVYTKVPFQHTTAGGALTATHLTVTYPASPPIPGSIATNVNQLAAEVVANVRGCRFGTGANGVTCLPRTWLLGDVFHSSSVVVPRPTARRPEQSYKDFKDPSTHPNIGLRDRVMVAGANDGFLHIVHAGDWQGSATPPQYDSGTGVELAAFAPYTARKNVKRIETDSGTRDYYFVDGPPSVADVWLYSSPIHTNEADKNASQWRTIVMGGMRQGGRQYYALDITDPSSSSYPSYLWEFPREDAAASSVLYMGETWSQPVITRVRVKVNGNDNGGEGHERWVAIFGAGYDKTSDPVDTASYSVGARPGRAIVMLDLMTGRVLGLKQFDPAGAASNPATFPYDPVRPERSMHYAFASEPSVFDLDFDGFADAVYIGDLGGNVWKWVIKNIGDDPINGSGSVSQPNWAFGRFFSAPVHNQSGTYYYKSIYHAPAATLKNGKLWLAFGTGERNKLDFAGFTGTTGENNRFYAVTDLDPHEEAPPAGGRLPLLESSLLNTTSNENCADVSAYRGYYFRGVDGEKFITSPEIAFYYAFVASYIPTPPVNPCESGGQATLYAFKVYCGEGLFTGGGGNPDRDLDLGDGLPTDPRITCGPDESGVIVNVRDRIEGSSGLPGMDGGSLTGQTSWRELSE